jgi:hypothetical protein
MPDTAIFDLSLAFSSWLSHPGYLSRTADCIDLLRAFRLLVDDYLNPV